MRRVHPSIARRLLTRGATRAQSSAAAAASAIHPIRIRTRGYGPSSDLTRGLPEHAALNVEATLHPEDAAIQRAVLALSMPHLAEVHVTPVLPHDSYASKVPRRSAEGAHESGSADVLDPTEREAMEQCLQEQLTVMANLVVEQIEQRTGRQLDALQVARVDEMKNFSEILLSTIQDELHQLRLQHHSQPAAAANKDSAAIVATADAAAPPPPIDVETVAAAVSARVLEQFEGVLTAQRSLHDQTAEDAAAAGAMAINAATGAAEKALSNFEERTAQYFQELQTRVDAVLSSSSDKNGTATASVPSHVSPETMAELRASVMEAVETVSARQQEGLATLVNNWLRDMEHRAPFDADSDARVSDNATVTAQVDMQALEETVESAVQASTDELRRLITDEVKKLTKAKKGRERASAAEEAGEESAAAGVSPSQVADLTSEVERVFDTAQSMQSRLVAMDEAVSDVFKEQAATRETLKTIHELLEKQLAEVRVLPAATPTAAAAADAPAEKPSAASNAAEATAKAIEETLTRLQQEVAATNSLFSVHHDDTKRQLLAVAQAVSESVTAAVEQRTSAAVQSAMATVQQQLEAVAASVAAATAATAEDRQRQTAAEEGKETAVQQRASLEPPPAAVEPLTKEVLASAVEAVLTPRWSELATEVQRLHASNQLTMEQQLLHMANSVTASVTASLEAHLESIRANAEAMRDATNASPAVAAAEEKTSEAAAVPPPAPIDSATMDSKLAATTEAVTSAITEKTGAQLAQFRSELLTSLQSDLRTTQTVDLTPMYKYIDSVLTFMKEELTLQETSLSAKIASLAETVTAAAQSSTAPQQQAEEDALVRTTAAAASTTAATATPPANEDAPTSPSTTPPIHVDIPAALTSSIEAQSAALRHLEERLNAVSLSQSKDVSEVLSKLQAATAEFHALSAKAQQTLQEQQQQREQEQRQRQEAWQAEVRAQLQSLNTSVANRDAELLEAVRASVSSDEVKTRLSQLEASLQSLSESQQHSLRGSLQEVVTGSAQEQATRLDALQHRVDEMLRALQEQHTTLQLLQPSPALVGLTQEQQQTQLRLRDATREHLRHVTEAVARLATRDSTTPVGEATQQRYSEAALQDLRAALVELQRLQEEEAAFHRDVAATQHGSEGASQRASSTLQSVVREEVAQAQLTLEKSIQGLSSHYDGVQREAAAAVETLLAKLEEQRQGTSSLPTLEDIQQLLDATVVRMKDEQKEEGTHLSQRMADATQQSAAELQSSVTATVQDALTASLEERLLPAYRATVDTALQSRLSSYAAEVQGAVRGVTAHTTAAMTGVEALLADVRTRQEEAVAYWKSEKAASLAEAEAVHAAAAPAAATPPEETTTLQMQSLFPLRWLVANAFLVCVVVLLSLYYAFACVLLAFVPKPQDGGHANATKEVAAVASAPTGEMPGGTPESRGRRGGRYVDRFM